MTQSDIIAFVVLILPFGIALWVGASLLVLHFWKEVADYREVLKRQEEHKRQQEEWRRKVDAGDYTE